MDTLNYIIDKIEQIELLVKSKAIKEIMNFDEFCEYLSISRSYGYKLTSARMVPHYKPNSKMIYFKRTEIDEWVLKTPIKTKEMIMKEASKYITRTTKH